MSGKYDALRSSSASSVAESGVSPVRIMTMQPGHYDEQLVQEAYLSFVKHASAIFMDDTVNPKTGQTIYADIETPEVWSRLAKGIESQSGKHHGVVSVAYGKDHHPVGFCLGIYHEKSNSANLTYVAVNPEYRGLGVSSAMEDQVVGNIGVLAKKRGHDGIAAVFVECEKHNQEPNERRAKSGFVSAIGQWHTPLLIADGEGGHVTQDMNLLAKWRSGLTPAEKGAAVSRFAQDFHALYADTLGDGKKLYPETSSLGYRDRADTAVLLRGMEEQIRSQYHAGSKAKSLYQQQGPK